MAACLPFFSAFIKKIVGEEKSLTNILPKCANTKGLLQGAFLFGSPFGLEPMEQ